MLFTIVQIFVTISSRVSLLFLFIKVFGKALKRKLIHCKIKTDSPTMKRERIKENSIKGERIKVVP
jgi:hypothetical protein